MASASSAPSIQKAAVAFTGGKDSVLSLHMVSDKFRRMLSQTSAASSLLDSDPLDPVVLVSFRPRSEDGFKAHKFEWMQMQAESLGLPLVVKYIGAEPTFEDSYRRGIRELREEYGVAKLVSGDIEDIGEGFMDRAATNTGVDLVRPLWKRPRLEILDLLARIGITYTITLTRLEKLPAPVSKRLLGHVITTAYLLEQFAWYDENHEPLDLGNSVDLAGEYGEMHSMVLDCPLFKCRIEHVGGKCAVHETKYGSYMYLEPSEIARVQK
ncbi:adenine nucleotide alpha hydrolases-like protein [Martensiomyces pterosporus]|nr:adenine nucleotide alpha hydrolases-like protein [Martensiomyces pterosporus]